MPAERPKGSLVDILRYEWSQGGRRLTENEAVFLASAQTKLDMPSLTLESLKTWIDKEKLSIIEEWSTKLFTSEQERAYYDIFCRAVIRNLTAIRKLISAGDKEIMQKELKNRIVEASRRNKK